MLLPRRPGNLKIIKIPLDQRKKCHSDPAKKCQFLSLQKHLGDHAYFSKKTTSCDNSISLILFFYSFCRLELRI